MYDTSRTLMKRLKKKARRGYRGDPVASVAFYGPDDRCATKVVVGISRHDDAPVDELRKWFSAAGDVRHDAGILEELLSYMEAQGVASVSMSPGIWGCPHEESIDYPEGGACPHCEFWKGRDRDAIFHG